MHLNLGSILQASAAARPEHVAVRHDDRTLRYAELDRAARGFATSLRARGIEPGMQVAIMVPNLPEFTMAYFGILYAGWTVVPLNVLLAGPEVKYHLEDSEAKLLVAHPLGRRGRFIRLVVLIDAGRVDELAHDAIAHLEADR